jgi:hypothetical protein
LPSSPCPMWALSPLDSEVFLWHYLSFFSSGRWSGVTHLDSA